MEPTNNNTNIAGGPSIGFFTPGQALAVFDAGFLDFDKCRRWILTMIHGKQPVCPLCARPIDDEARLQRFWSGQRVMCRHCQRFFSATSRTFLSGCHMDFNEIYLLAVLLAAGLDNCRIANVLDCNPETVRLWRHRFSGMAELGKVESK